MHSVQQFHRSDQLLWGSVSCGVSCVNSDGALKLSVIVHHTAVTSCKTIIFVFLSVLHTWKQFTAPVPKTFSQCWLGPTDGSESCYWKCPVLILTGLLTGCRLSGKVERFKTVHNKIFKSLQQHTRWCTPSFVLAALCFICLPNNSSNAVC